MNGQIIPEAEPSSDVSRVGRHRFLRCVSRLEEARARGDLAAGEQAIEEFKRQHGRPATETEQWAMRIETLLSDPPYLHNGEREFLVSMARSLDSGKEPTERQAGWVGKIERRRR